MNTRKFMRVAALAAFIAASVVALTLAGPGSGTATIAPPASVAAGSSGEWSVVYTAAEVHDDGTVRVTIPSGWTTPQNGSSTSPGFVTVSTNEPTGAPGLSIAGQVITVVVDTLSAGNALIIVYGNDGAGASARATAATNPGTHAFLVESDPLGGSVSPIVSSPSLTVTPAAPSSLEILPNDSTATAGDFVQMHVRVLDAFGNRTPVPANRTVNLIATNGQFFDPSNHSTPITSIVITGGTNSKRVDYRSTLVAGSPHNIVAFTPSGSPSLGGSTFISLVAAALSVTQSTISATSPVSANGGDQSTVVVTSRDAFGNPREGDTVAIATTGSATHAGPGAPTDVDGEATAAVANTVAEPVTISATIAGQAVTSGNPVVQFVAGPVSAAESEVTATSPVIGNGSATSTITITVRDAFNNPVSGRTVTLAVTPPGGFTLTQPGGVTGPNGQITGSLSSTVLGLRTVTATVNGPIPIIDDAVIDFIHGPIASFQWTSDGVSTAGAFENVTLRARDANGNTVLNYTGTVSLATTTAGVGDGVVQWDAVSPDAHGVMVNQTEDDATYTFVTADNGDAILRVTNTRAETFQVRAQDGAAIQLSGNIVNGSAIADKIEVVSGNGQSATVNTPVASAPMVRVLDQFNNVVSAAPVTFTAVQGNGSVDVVAGGAPNDSTVLTATDGRIDCDVWRLGTIVGTNRLRARIASGSIPFVYFNASSTPGPGTALDITPNSQPVTQGTALVVTTALTDTFGNPKPGEVVTIAITDGPDGTLALNPADPNPTTTINASTRSGTTDAAGHITVLYNAPGAAPLSDVVDASTGSVGQGAVVNSVYTTTASGATNLRITFVGPSTRPANQNIQFLVEAVDGNGNPDPSNISTVDLTPEVGGSITFSLDPGFSSTVTQATLVSGAVTVYARGTVSGDWDITTSTGGLGNDIEVVTITDTGVIDHYSVVSVPSVVAGVLFDVTVEAQDVFNNRVMGANNSVNLEAYDDVANNPALSTLLVPSAALASGRVTVGEAYTRAEAIRVRASAGANQGFSNIVTVSAAPAHRIAKISGDGTGIIAGANRVLTAQVLDQFDNPVQSALVSFVVLEGGGSPAPPSDNTDVSGNAATTYVTGTTVGTNRIKATIGDENPPSLERVEYLVSTIAGPVASFTVTPASFSLVAGTGVALNVTGFDANNNLVSNDDTTPIDLTETGSAQFGAASGLLTDGQFNTTVVDTVAESFTITASKQSGPPATGTSGTLTVSHAGAYRVTKVSGDASGVTAGGAQVLEVLVRDSHSNPVPNALVTFATTGGINDGTFTDAVGDPSDGITTTLANGHATVTFTTSQTAGANQVNSTILDGTPPGRERVTFTVNTIAGGISYYTVQMTGGFTVVAGQTRNVTVTAYDSNNNPVDDNVTQVDLSGDPGTGLVFGSDPVQLTNGVATTTVRADLVQTYQVRAGVLPGPSGLGEQVTVSPANPAGIITGTPTPATITANGVSTSNIVSSIIVDAFGNQVPAGTAINVSATNGGVVLSGSPKLVAANGRIAFDLRSSTAPGTSVVTMTSQVGTATGTVNVTFAAPPAFTAGIPNPSIVAPSDNVAFSVVVQNTSANDANLSVGTTFGFTDGTRTYSANLVAPITIAGGGNQNLVFASAVVNAAFTPAFYQPTVTMVGIDENDAPISTPVLTPAQSLLLTSIQITGISAPSVVSRGQTPTVTVSVKNNGAQDVDITDIDLSFTPGGGIFTPGSITGQTLASQATGQFNIPVLVDPSCPVNTYTIDAVATGNVAGKTVTDLSIAPLTAPTWQIIAAANLSYVAGSMTPMSVSRGAAYQFRATISNGGAGVVSLDSSLTTILFTDGTRTYQAKPSQPYAIAGSSQQQIVFKTRAVASNFTIGAYTASFHLQGLEGGAPFSQDITSGADQVAVQLPANPVDGTVSPDVVSKGSSVAFTVQVNNSGGATVVLTPATTEFRFNGGAFTADLNPSGPTSLPPGNTTLTFLSAPVSGAIVAGSYPGSLVLVGTENGNPFSRTQATENVVVEDAPSIQIIENEVSQTPITQDQARPFKVRMIVQNNGGAAVTFTDASIKFIQAGQDRSGQFNISDPAGFAIGGSTLNGGAADTVIFNITDNTGNVMTAPSMMTVQGFLEVEDVNTQQPIFAERELGDFLQVQSPAVFNVIAVLPSRTTVTQNMTRPFLVRALVQNTGTSDMTLNLTNGPTDVTFSLGTGWQAAPRPDLGHGGNVLAGGEIDTVLFDVTTSGSATGTALVNTNYTATETNSGRTVTGGTSGSAQIEVQSPGNITVTNVVASRATITSQASVAWTLTVSVQNTGQSDVNVNLGNLIGVTFQDATTQPSLTRPTVFAGGGTVLSGGEIDQIVIGVGNSGTYSTPGLKDIGVGFTGTELNSNVARNGNGNTTVTVQQQPALNVISVSPATVSRGSIVAFQVTIENVTTNGATATLNPFTTRLVFGSNAYNVNLDATSPLDVAANQQITLLFNPAQVGASIPTGPQADATLQFRFIENDTPRIDNEGFNAPPKQITVQNAPALNITNVRASRQNITAGQTSPAWHITMALTNSNGSDVDLNLAAAVTKLELNQLGTGAPVISEYTIVQPTALVGGGIRLSSGETDSLIFDVTQAGTTAGNIIVSGFVGGTDVVSSLPVNDNTGDGGSGSFALQTPGALSILSMTPQRATATQSQTPDYTIKMAVRNTGQAAIDLDLVAPTTTAVTFSSPAGWATNVQSTMVIGGDVRLSGGETDTLVFNVTTTGSVAAVQTISGNVVGFEANTGASRSDNTASGGTGSITVQTPAVIDILSAVPTPGTLTDNAGTAQPWDLTVVVENTGQSAARLVLPTGLLIAVQSAAGATFDPVSFLEEGGVVLAGGATGTLVVHADAAPDFSALGTRTIGVSLDAVELNSNRTFNRDEPTVGNVVVEAAPNLTVALVGSPVLVTQGTQAFLQLDITNPGANAATVELDPGNTRVSFAGGLYSAVMQLVSPTTIGPGQTVRVSFEDKVINPSITAGPYTVSVNLQYTANGLNVVEPESVPNGVTVQVPGAFRITGIVTSQPSVTRNQTATWTATMSIVNEGATPIDLNLALNKTYLQFLVPGGGIATDYDYDQPTALAGGGTQLGIGMSDQLVFTITQTGDDPGIIVISGRVEGNDPTIVFDDTFDGGRGSIAVVPAAAVSVLATHTSKPRVTAGQTGSGASWDVRVVVANTGGAAVNLDLATSNITFSGAGGFVVTLPPTFLGGTNPLTGGSVDSLLFRVTTTSPTAGTRQIDASIPWQDVNNPTTTGTANTTTSGFGSIEVQTPVNLRITTTTSQSPNPAAVNTSQAFAVRVQVENTGTGHATARDVALVLNTNGGSSVTQISPITQVASGETVTRDFAIDAAAVPNGAETFTSVVTAMNDENSGQVVAPQPALDDNAVVAIQLPSVFDVTNVRPSQGTVTRSQTQPWNVIVRVRNTGQSGAVLAIPAANDILFELGGTPQVDYVVQPPTALGSGRPGWTVAGSDQDSLFYRVAVTGAGTGVVDITATDDGTDRNDPTLPFSDFGATSVNVQLAAGFAIDSTIAVGPVNSATADRDTVNTGFAYQMEVVVTNSGEDIDSVLVLLTSNPVRSTIAPASLIKQQLDASESHTFVFNVTSPVNPVALETFTANIQSNVLSRNTGQVVNPQPPIDNRQDVVTQRRADLVMNLTSASGAVSTNQVFTMSATVTNAGQANVEGTAEMTLTVPAGFTHVNPGGTEPLTRPFAIGVPVTWQIQAQGTAQPLANFTTAISTTPNDRNTNAPAFASQPTDNFGVAVVSGGAFTSPTLAITAPAGAVDGTVSAGQNNIAMSAGITATTTTVSIVATLSVPAGYSIVGSPTRNVGAGTGSPQTVTPAFGIIAPAGAGVGDVFVTFTGIDDNTDQPVPTAADTVTITTIPGAALTTAALVTAPPEATDNTVTIGTTFTVSSTVTNAAGAAGVSNAGTLTISLPSGYTLASGTAAQPFTIAAPVTWQVVAPPQPSGPQQINVTITTVPLDENSGQAALVVDGSASIAMVTEGSAVSVRDVSTTLGIDVGPVPAGTSGVQMLGFEIAYNVSDASVADARIDTLAITIVGDDGSPLGPGTVAATLSSLSIDIGGATPYEVTDPSTNPVVVSFMAGAVAERSIAPDAARNAIVSVSLDANPSATEFSVGLRTGGVVVKDNGSGQRLGVTDSQGQPLDGVITSEPLVILSSSFEEYVHNYPNPFRAGSQETRIAYVMERAGSVSILIYAVDGSLVHEENISSSDARAQAGPQEATWDGRNGKGEVVRNGVYVCVVNAAGRSAKFRIAVAK